MTILRWAVADDAEALADVHVTTWQTAYVGILPEGYLNALDRKARSRWWRRFIEEGAMVHVADDDGVVGFCHAAGSIDEDLGEVYSIYVHPGSWGQGHGRALLAAGESTILSLGFDMALLWVLEGNTRARGFLREPGLDPGSTVRGVEEIGGEQVTELRYQKRLTDGL